MDIVGIITARGGSKGLPQKNILKLAGKPLIVHTIEAALQSKLLNRCVVTTEDQEIKAISLEAGAEVIDRPAHLAEDESLSRDVILHALQLFANKGNLPEYFVLLQPTSPLRKAKHIDACIKLFLEKQGGSCVSVTISEHTPYKMFQICQDHLVPFCSWEDLDKPRQNLPKTFRHNGAIYVVKSKDFLEKQTFFIKPVIPYIMGKTESLDIDTKDDFALCESIAEVQTGAHHT